MWIRTGFFPSLSRVRVEASLYAVFRRPLVQSRNECDVDTEWGQIRILAVCFALIISGIIIFSRWHDAIYNPQFWAEDGEIFYAQVKKLGIASLFSPYAGYFHAIPRLTAQFATLWPSSAAPRIYLSAAALSSFWAVFTIATVRLPLAPLYAATLMVVPHSGEVFGTITNAQWITACALPLIAASPPPKSTLLLVNHGVFLLLAGLSGPFAIWTAPFFGLRLCTERHASGVALCAIALSTAVVQAMSMSMNYVPFTGERDPAHLAIVLMDRWIGGMASGWRIETPAALLKGLFFGSAMALTVVWNRQNRFINLRLLTFALAVLAATWIKFMPGLSNHMDWPALDDRYIFIPRVMSTWILISGLCAWSRITTLPAALSLALIPTSYWVHDHDFWTKRPLPSLAWTDGADKIDAGVPVDIPINPMPYHVKLP